VRQAKEWNNPDSGYVRIGAFKFDRYHQNKSIDLDAYFTILHEVTVGEAPTATPRKEPFVNFDRAKLNALAQEFLIESMNITGGEDPRYSKNPVVKKFMAFRDFAMAVADKEHEQVYAPTPDPIEMVLKALDKPCGSVARNDLVALHPKQVEGLKTLVVSLMGQRTTNQQQAADLFREALH